MRRTRPASPPLHLADVPGGPPPGTLLCHLSDLPDHGGRALAFRDHGGAELRLLVQRLNGTIRVFENRCPHVGTPLNLFGERFLNSDGTALICRTHGALFDPLSGRCVQGPCKGDFLREVAVTERNGALYSR
ncbi:Rieske (2Fe-2S) protein [Yunchengibacter salinarum]|uniref:Rieske (2Fe-2S) protein n=1 Tax=Yunchengibacter salinarum TaxID=3133399 RepID=UPI0035B600F0